MSRSPLAAPLVYSATVQHNVQRRAAGALRSGRRAVRARSRSHGARALAGVRGGAAVARMRGGAGARSVPCASGGGLRVRRGRRAPELPLRRAAPPAAAA